MRSTLEIWRRTIGAFATAAIVAAGGATLLTAAGGQREGIKVHGHWTIEVRNPDGTLSARHEFENALVDTGAVNLARLLSRANAPGMWGVSLYSPAGTPNCMAIGIPCILSEHPGYGAPLRAEVPSEGPNAGRLVLSGSFTSPTARTFIAVDRGFELCQPQSPGCSAGTLAGAFSRKDFSAPFPSAEAGQIVQITVTFSFS
jgi:hypothetical protein